MERHLEGRSSRAWLYAEKKQEGMGAQGTRVNVTETGGNKQKRMERGVR